MFENATSLTLGGKTLIKLATSDAILWEEPSSYTNQVSISINADGSIYNGGLGYKLNTRVRSGGAEQTDSSLQCICTGYMPVKGGSIVRIQTPSNFFNGGTTSAINVSDSSFTNLGQVVGNVSSGGYGIFTTYTDYDFSSVVQESANIYKWVVPPAESGIAFIRVTVNTIYGESIIITVDEEIV